MFNAKQFLDQLVQGMEVKASSSQTSAGLGGVLSNPTIAGALSGVGGGLLAGLLFNNKNVSKIGGNVATVGGTAALTVIATKAYQNWQAKKNVATQNTQQQPQQSVLDFDSLPKENQEEQSRAILTAVIAAAKADGYFDERERQIIREHAEKIGDADTMAWVQQQINKPLDANEIAALATSPELAAEIYLASLLVIDVQNESEKLYLNSLAEKLKLEPQLRLEIEQQLTQSNL